VRLLNICIENVEKTFLDNKNHKIFTCKFKVEGKITLPYQLIFSIGIMESGVQLGPLGTAAPMAYCASPG
jgi:hypothetical protein